MIRSSSLTAWQSHAPWPRRSQIEQDLRITRGIAAIFSDAVLRDHLAMRGGTVLHKGHLAPAARYSEDIDLVLVKPMETDALDGHLRRVLTPVLGRPSDSMIENALLAIRNVVRPSRLLRTAYRFVPLGLSYQETIKVEEVARELRAARTAVGSGVDVAAFTREALQAHGAAVSVNGALKAVLSDAPRALREAIEQLATAQVPSASLAAELLLLHVLDRDRTFLYAHPEAKLSLEQERAYRHLLGQRAAGKPTQYLIKQQEFWDLTFHVEPGVFIPRPETEHVVEVALDIVRARMRQPKARLVDVGTGTGCIALALASELPEAEILATDISEEALGVARRNADALGLASRVRFLHGDLLGPFLSHHGVPEADFDTRPFDLVVSNPPYVGREEAERLPPEVRDHEPPQALFSDGEGLAITRRLIEQSRVLLAGGGWLVLELGYQMAGRVKALLGDAWAQVEITNDLAGIPRVLAAQKV